MNDFFYRNLQVYQSALLQVKAIYSLTNLFPAGE